MRMSSGVIFTIGACVGGLAVYAWFRVINQTYAVGKALLIKAAGDLHRAWAHINRLG